jgi:AAA ATPase domain
MHFKCNIPGQSILRGFTGYEFWASYNKIPLKVSLKVSKGSIEYAGYLREIKLEILKPDAEVVEEEIVFVFFESGEIESLWINKENFSEHADSWVLDQNKGGIIPLVDVEYDYSEEELKNTKENRHPYYQIENEVKKGIRKNIKKERIRTIIWSFGGGDRNQMLSSMKTALGNPESWRNYISSWTTDTKDFTKIRNLVIAWFITSLTQNIDRYLSTFIRTSRYIAPLRATAERYYRVQNLAVNEIDFQGENLPMFLRSLSIGDFQELQEWIRQNFGFHLSLNFTANHTSIQLTEEGSKKSFNIADKGFGFSQILPILIEIFMTGRRRKSMILRGNLQIYLIAIEQPELHLHPRLQAKLIDVFVRTVKRLRNLGIDLRILLETHSEQMVNRLGHLVRKAEIKHDEVNVVLFEKVGKEEHTLITQANYDENGFLVKWPIGFFDPEDI